MPVLQLMAKSMGIPKHVPRLAPIAQKIDVERAPEVPTPEQMRDRAAVQKQALVDWQSRQQRKSRSMTSISASRETHTYV